jgi:hypothetical protein
MAASRATAVEPAQEEWLVETVAATSDQGIEDQVPGTSGQTSGATTESSILFETPNSSVFTNAGSTQSPMVLAFRRSAMGELWFFFWVFSTHL